MPTFLFLAAICLLVAASILLETDASPKKNAKLEKGAPSSGKAQSSPGVLKAFTGLLALQSVLGLAHGRQTPSEVTFKVPAVNNQPSTPEMIMTNDYAPVRKRPPIHN
uniref:Uncharacterized protein n=1 Tax=Globodera rostochiensis TaxID=31243 RepID=A0A914H9R0_GLORO